MFVGPCSSAFARSEECEVAAACLRVGEGARASRRRRAGVTVVGGIRHNYKIRKDKIKRGEIDPDLDEEDQDRQEREQDEVPDFPDLVAGTIPNPILALENGEDILSNLNTGAATAASYYYLQSHRNVEYDYMAPGVRPDPVQIPDDPNAKPVDMFIPEWIDPRRGLPPGIDPREWLVALYGRVRTPEPHENRRLILKAFIGVSEFHLYAVKHSEGVIAEVNSMEREIGPYRGSRSIQCIQLLAEVLLERLRRAGYEGIPGKDVPLADKPILQLGRFVFEGEKVKRSSRQRVKAITETLYRGGIRIGVNVDKWITDHKVRFDRAYYERTFEEYYMTGCADIIGNFRLLTPGPKLRQKLKKAARKTYVARQLRASLGEDIELDETEDEDDWGGHPNSAELAPEDDEEDFVDVPHDIGSYRQVIEDRKPSLMPYYDAPAKRAEVAIVDDSLVESAESLKRDFAAMFDEDDDDDKVDIYDNEAVADAVRDEVMSLRDDEMSRTRKLEPSEKFVGAAAFADSVLRKESPQSDDSGSLVDAVDDNVDGGLDSFFTD